MDDLIYEEFKGTGNMEVHLDRRLAEKRIFPAINVLHSSTRREDLLFSDEMLKQVYVLRRIVGMLSEDSSNNTEATERLIDRLAKTQTNAEFLANLAKDTSKSA
jgi:transcription termination factor Rho